MEVSEVKKRTFVDIANDYLDGKITLKEFFKQIEEYENRMRGNN